METKTHIRIHFLAICVIFLVSTNYCRKPEEPSEGKTVLPVKLINSSGVDILDFESLTGWSSSGTKELNTTQFHAGSASIKLTSTSGTNALIMKTGHWDFSADNAGTLKFWVYPHSAPVTTFTGYYIYAAKDPTMTDYFLMWVNAATCHIRQGQWNLISAARQVSGGGWSVGAGKPNWNDINFFSIKVVNVTGEVSINSFDDLQYGGTHQPVVLFTIDDGYLSSYTKLFPLLKAKNMVATAYMVSQRIDAEGSNTSAQLKELYANGWDIGNHTKSHPHLIALTQAEIETELNDCKIVLDGLGLTRASNHIAYPYIEYNETVIAAMKNWGAKTGRGGLAIYQDQYEIGFPYYLNGDAPALTSEASRTYIDNCILSGSACIFILHDLTDPKLFAVLSDIVDYCETKGVQSLTIDEYYRLYSSSITVYHK
jgi:peptidoglycan/xylan/chitin deacetylase (PgdA/CDA1 family)